MRVKQTPERGFERIQMQLTRFSAYHTGLYNFLLLVHHVFHVVNSEKVKLYSARDPGYLIMPLPSYGLSCGIYSSMATCAVFSTAIALRLLTKTKIHLRQSYLKRLIMGETNVCHQWEGCERDVRGQSNDPAKILWVLVQAGPSEVKTTYLWFLWLLVSEPSAMPIRVWMCL